jgi:hypothetical protein
MRVLARPPTPIGEVARSRTNCTEGTLELSPSSVLPRPQDPRRTASGPDDIAEPGARYSSDDDGVDTQDRFNHIHSVIRRLAGDWGDDVIGSHYEARHC